MPMCVHPQTLPCPLESAAEKEGRGITFAEESWLFYGELPESARRLLHGLRAEAQKDRS